MENVGFIPQDELFAEMVAFKMVPNIWINAIVFILIMEIT